MPSIAELCEVYKNKGAVNASLSKINGLNSAYADEAFGNRYCCSSSQFSNYYHGAWFADFGIGYLDVYFKSSGCWVCCIAGF